MSILKSDQTASLEEIGISKNSIQKLDEILSERFKSFEAGDLNALNFDESVLFISQEVHKILQKEFNQKFFDEKLRSIRKTLLGGIELSTVLGKKINFEVFPPGSPLLNADSIEPTARKDELNNHPEMLPRKYWTMKALKNLDINFTVRESKDRKDKTEAYALFFVPAYKCAVAVANAYGKASYFFPLDNWEKFAKARKVDDLRPDERVNFLTMSGARTQSDLEKSMKSFLLEMKKKSTENIMESVTEKNDKKVGVNVTTKEPEISEVEQMAYYKKCLEAEIPRLKKEAGLIEYEGKFIFLFMCGNDKWGNVGNFGSLKNFPSASFLRKNKLIESHQKGLRNREELKNFFKFLNFSVLNEAEEKIFYKSCIEKEIPRLKKEARLIEHDGRYIFSFVKGASKWGCVGDLGNLQSFPSGSFLKSYEIISKDRNLMNTSLELKKLFTCLGFSVADETEIKMFYKDCIEQEIPRLKEKVGLVEHNGNYIFSFLKMDRTWENVGNFGSLKTFPSMDFLRKSKIISEDSDENFASERLKKLFLVLGLPVATDDEARDFYKYSLEQEIGRLKKDVGLIEHNGKYIFSLMKEYKQWGKIQSSKNIRSFPSSEVLRGLKVINPLQREMTNPEQLKRLFEVLGLSVANESEEKIFYKSCIEKEIPRLKEKAGLIEHNGKYIFSFVKGVLKWGKVGEYGNLTSFPGRDFLRQYGIIEKDGKSMTNPEQLKRLFEVLGLPMANESEKRIFYRSCIEKEIPRLKEKFGLIEHNGRYVFNFVKGAFKWGKVGEYGSLMTFPSGEFLRQYGILEKKGTAMTNPKQLKRLFEVLGLSVASEKEDQAYLDSVK